MFILSLFCNFLQSLQDYFCKPSDPPTNPSGDNAAFVGSTLQSTANAFHLDESFFGPFLWGNTSLQEVVVGVIFRFKKEGTSNKLIDIGLLKFDPNKPFNPAQNSNPFSVVHDFGVVTKNEMYKLDPSSSKDPYPYKETFDSSKSYQDLDFYKDETAFVLFTRDQIWTLIQAGKLLTGNGYADIIFSGCEIDAAKSISKIDDRPTPSLGSKFFSLKAEVRGNRKVGCPGINTNTLAAQAMDASAELPVIIYGHPCPPYWIPTGVVMQYLLTIPPFSQDGVLNTEFNISDWILCPMFDLLRKPPYSIAI